MKKKSIVIIIIATLIISAILFVGYSLFGDKILFEMSKVKVIQEEKWSYSVDKKRKTAKINKYLGNEINVVVPESVTVDKQEYKVTIIGEGTFEECNEIESIDLAKTVSTIESDAFKGCTSLSKLNMPEDVKTIGLNAFEECDNLKNINIANSKNSESVYDKNYIDYLQLSTEDKAKIVVIPRKEFVSIDTLSDKAVNLLGTEVADLDSSYDLRDYIDITVENQGDSSWCWAYTSLKALDTYTALNLDVNYNSSEAHLAHMRSEYFSDDDFWESFWSDVEGTDFTTTENIYNSGGNFFDFHRYGTHNYGPVLESEIPNTKYAMTEANKSKLEEAEKYIKLVDTEDYPSITKEYNEDGTIVYKNGDKVCTQEEVEAFRDTIKMHIMQYGGVYTCLEACPDSGTAYYNSDTASYYWEGDKSQLKRDLGHAVTIVGWDDNYSKNNFNSSLRPTNDGAYLCVNSWGTGFGKSGYFYISYDDINVEEYLSGVTEAEEIPQSMEITKLPTKTQFVQAYENLDVTGGEITLTAKGGNKKVISMTDSRVSITGYSNKNLGKITLTVKYKYGDYLSYNCSATYEVDIVEPTVTKIEVSTLPTQLNYVKGYEQLNLTGGKIKIIYNSNDSWNKSLSMSNSEISLSEMDNSTLGEKTITVTYKDKTTQFKVSVVEITKMELTVIPGKTIYMQNDTVINLIGGKITVTFNNGDTRIVETSNVNVVPETLNSSTLGETIIKLNYYTHSVSYNVQIIENYFEYTKSGSYIKITKYNGNETEVVVPKYIYESGVECTVNEIGSAAFKGCSFMTNIQLPDSVTKIDNDAFLNCTGLVEFKLPLKISSIGGRAFSGCTKLEKVLVDENNSTYKVIDGILFDKSLKTIIYYPIAKTGDKYIIPNGITGIAKNAFYGCKYLKNVEIPRTITTIGEDAFTNFTGLTSIEIPNSVTTVGKYAFSYCTKLEKVKIPDSVTKIETSAFAGCTSLRNVKIPNSVTTLQSSVFENCRSLSRVELSNNIKTIEKTMFRGCTSLEQIEISNGVTSINGSDVYATLGAFADCTGLKYIYIPSTVTTIGSGVFYNCSNLKIYTSSDATNVISYAKDNNIPYEIVDNPLVSISIAQAPYDIEYREGERFNSSGLAITAHYQDGSSSNVTGWVLLDSTTIGSEQEYVTISYTEKAITRTVRQNINYIDKILEGITITNPPTKTIYNALENFETNGMVVEAAYDDDTTEIITNYTVVDGENLTAGKNSVTISYTKEEVTKIDTQEITVNQLQGSISNIQDLSKIYNGEKVSNPTYTKVGDGQVSFEWYKVENGKETSLNEAPTNVGNYKVKVILVETTNYKGATVEKAFKISKATYNMNSIKFENTTYTYDGTEKKVEITGILPVGVSVSYQNNKATNAGEYNAVAIFNGDSTNYNSISNKTAKLTINKAQGSISNIQDLSKVYNGQKVSDPTYTKVGDGPVTFEWYKVENGKVTSLNEAPTNVGNYKVKVILEESTNYKGATAEKTFTISKATYNMGDVEFESASYIYDGTEKKVEITGTLPTGVAVSYQNNKATNAGEYNAVAIFSGDSMNYNTIENKTAKLTINQAQGTIVNTNKLDKIYDGEAVSIDKNYNITGDGEVSIYWFRINGDSETEIDNAPMNVGRYKVKIILENGVNYKGTELEDIFSISKATYDMKDIKFEDATYIYDGTEKKVEITGILPVGVSVSYQNNKATNVGEYNAIASFTGDSDNYNSISNKTAKLIISARQGRISDIEDLSKVYDGEKVSNPTYKKEGDGTVSFGWYKIENGDEISLNEAPANAGKYKVKVVLSGTTNYSGAIAEKIFTISKATYNMNGIKFEDATFTYDGTEKKIEKIGTLPEGVSVSYRNNKATNVGEYNAVAIFTGDSENYKSINNMEAKLTILKADPEYVLPENLTATYGQTLREVSLPTGFTWEDEETTNVGNVGENVFTVTYTPEDILNYSILNNINITITVRKADPNYTIPTGLSAEYGQTLAEVSLPAGFTWEDDLETSVGEIGNNTFKVTYTPEDTYNYKIITGIDVEIKVVEKLELNVENYYIDDENHLIAKIKPNTSLEKFKLKLKSNIDYEVFNKNNESILDHDNIGTGYKLKFTNGKEYTLVVYGDLNGDAKVNVIDVARLQKIIVKTINPNEITMLAADLKEDLNINILDLAKLQKLVIGYNIF